MAADAVRKGVGAGEAAGEWGAARRAAGAGGTAGARGVGAVAVPCCLRRAKTRLPTAALFAICI